MEACANPERSEQGHDDEALRNTDFGPVPQSWAVEPIGAFTKRSQYGLSLRGNGTGRYPILRMNCQEGGQVTLRDLQYVDLDDSTFHAFRLRRGDLLFNRTNSYELVGRVAMVQDDLDAVFASYLVRLSLDQDRLLPAYLNYFLNWEVAQSELKKLASRAVGQANINATKLSQFRVPVPPLGEQVPIAQVLDAVRSATGIARRSEEKATALKRVALQHLFTRGLRGEAQKEAEIGPVPKSWEIVRVEDNACAISKGASPKWQGFNYVDKGVLFVRSQNVGDGIMLWDDRAFLPVQWNEKEKRSILRAGDVLINLVGASIGRCAVGGPEIEGANCNQAVCFVRLDRNKVLPEVLSGFLLTVDGQRQIHSNKKDIARANLSLQDVRQTVIPKPPIEEQREIVTVLSALDRTIDLHRKKRAVLDELFKALLHKLMTGEIRVADLDLSALARAHVAEIAA